MEILDMIVENDELIAMAIGAVIGALLIAFTCYVVSKVKHDSEIRDAYNEAKLAGEDYPEWKLAKSSTWYKGYKLALVILSAMSAAIGFGVSVVAMKYGYADGMIESAACAFVGALIGGLVVDRKVIHPIADNEFLVKCETPIVDAFLQPADPVTEPAQPEVDPSVLAIARKLKEEGLI